MRTVRWLTSGLALAALVPSLGAAQQSSSRLFENSWFWGAKGGVMSFSTEADGNTAAPLVGVEWLITRTHGALYISGEQSFFKATSSVNDRFGQEYRVAIRDMRRYTAAALAFPWTWGTVRPYGGVGFSLNNIQRTALIDMPSTDTSIMDVAAQVDHQKDRTSFITMAGIQGQYQRVSLFGQVTYMPAKSGFLLNGRSTYILEAGIRYNFGSSKERLDR
ncbi:MAG TPA: hypothetical protein VIR34_09255 [Gemmatimonadaceae bacterium]|jgi:hypothetical protein